MSEYRYFRVMCNECGWTGSSKETYGGCSIADTGDYGEIVCPKCCDERERWVSVVEDLREAEKEVVR